MFNYFKTEQLKPKEIFVSNNLTQLKLHDRKKLTEEQHQVHSKHIHSKINDFNLLI